MIKVIDRTFIIPPSEKMVGCVGENAVETRVFELTNSNHFPLHFTLELENSKGGKGFGYITKQIVDDKLLITWIVKNKDVAEPGMLTAQLKAFDNTSLVWKSLPKLFEVSTSINAETDFPDPLPSAFIGMQQDVTAKHADVVEKHGEILEAAETVAGQADDVSANHTEVLAKALEVVADRIRAEAAADNAEGSSNIASQALADLLAMLGTDIATLTNGKLTPSQIPAIAVTDTFVVPSQADMLALTAETGDVCIRTDESKTYILQNNEPSEFTNWRQLQSPTNYADYAGHAATADNAENAQKINGHRVVYMTQEQYDNAVIDPDTFYFVGVE